MNGARHLSITAPGAVLIALAFAGLALAQPSQQRIPRVGFCAGFNDPGHIFTKTFYEGMRKRGWEDGRNVRIIMPPREDRPQKTCGDYMADKELDVLVQEQHSDPHPKIPVVTKLTGVAGSALARSSTRNITGITLEHYSWEVDSKRIALLKEAVGAERVLLMSAAMPGPGVRPGLGTMDDIPAELRDAAGKLGVAIVPATITRREDLLEPGLNAMAAKPRSAAIVYDSRDWYRVGAAEEITLFMLKHRKRLPVMALKADWVLARYPIPELERIIAYGTSYLDERDRYAYFVDRILRGAKPSELPFEQTPNRLALNLDAARASGITFPQSILVQADWVVPHRPRFEWTTTPEPPPATQSEERKRAEWEERMRAILRSQ